MIFSEYSVNNASIDGCGIIAAVAINSKMLLKEA
tara:strand:+ start:175 stop:276 length:102 start_codon:yes stop_codon:yes gene_type:complete